MPNTFEVVRCRKCKVLRRSEQVVLDKSVTPYDYICREECQPVTRLEWRKMKRVPRPPTGWTQITIWITRGDRETVNDLLDIPTSTWLRDRLNELLVTHQKPKLFPRRRFSKIKKAKT